MIVLKPMSRANVISATILRKRTVPYKSLHSAMGNTTIDPALRSPQPRNPNSLVLNPRLQPSHQLPKPLRLPLQWHLIDMLFPKCHLRPIFHTNNIKQPISRQRFTPEGTVFDPGDAEVDGFGGLVGLVVDAEADDARGEEVREHLAREIVSGPGSWVVDG